MIDEPPLIVRMDGRVVSTVLSSQPFPDRFQFPSPLRRGLGIGHLEFIERIQNNLGNDQSGVLLVVGRNTWQPCGLISGMTCRMAPSLPAASIP